MNIFKKIILTIRCRINPVKYLRSVGVKVGEGTLVYNKNPNMVTTEPWLISIGNNCVITGGG